MPADKQSIGVRDYDYLRPYAFAIAIRTSEAENYAQENRADLLVYCTISNAHKFTFILETGIIEDTLTKSVMMAAHHGSNLFRLTPDDRICVIDSNETEPIEYSLTTLLEKMYESGNDFT